MSRILLVDDDEDMLAMSGRWLERAGYEVTKVSSGKEALSVLAEWIPDLILLDYAMPEMNGPALLKEIRAVEELKKIPVLYRTGMDDQELGGNELKPDGIVPKSGGKPCLMKAIGEFLPD